MFFLGFVLLRHYQEIIRCGLTMGQTGHLSPLFFKNLMVNIRIDQNLMIFYVFEYIFYSNCAGFYVNKDVCLKEEFVIQRVLSLISL